MYPQIVYQGDSRILGFMGLGALDQEKAIVEMAKRVQVPGGGNAVAGVAQIELGDGFAIAAQHHHFGALFFRADERDNGLRKAGRFDGDTVRHGVIGGGIERAPCRRPLAQLFRADASRERRTCRHRE